MAALRFEECRKRGIRRIDEVREQVDVAAILDRGDLGAAHETQAVAVGRSICFREPRQRVAGGGALDLAPRSPASVSWSVTLMVSRPRAAARSTSAEGASRPSEAVV